MKFRYLSIATIAICAFGRADASSSLTATFADYSSRSAVNLVMPPLRGETLALTSAAESDKLSFEGHFVGLTTRHPGLIHPVPARDRPPIAGGTLLITNTSVLTLAAMDNPGQVTLVPEPETYAMFLAGLGLLGAAVRRRRQA